METAFDVYEDDISGITVDCMAGDFEYVQTLYTNVLRAADIVDRDLRIEIIDQKRIQAVTTQCQVERKWRLFAEAERDHLRVRVAELEASRDQLRDLVNQLERDLALCQTGAQGASA